MAAKEKSGHSFYMRFARSFGGEREVLILSNKRKFSSTEYQVQSTKYPEIQQIGIYPKCSWQVKALGVPLGKLPTLGG